MHEDWRTPPSGLSLSGRRYSPSPQRRGEAEKEPGSVGFLPNVGAFLTLPGPDTVHKYLPHWLDEHRHQLTGISVISEPTEKIGRQQCLLHTFLMGTDFLTPSDPHPNAYITREKTEASRWVGSETAQTSVGSLRPCVVGTNTLCLEFPVWISRTGHGLPKTRGMKLVRVSFRVIREGAGRLDY